MLGKAWDWVGTPGYMRIVRWVYYVSFACLFVAAIGYLAGL